MSERTSVPSKVRTLPVLAAVAVVAVMLAMLLAAPVFASPSAAPASAHGLTPSVSSDGSPSVQQWAYAGTKTITGDVKVTGSNGTGFELQYHAFYGWTVVFTQTNNSTNTGFQIEAQRTAAAELYVNLCTPDCSAANWTGNYTASVTEQTTAFGNFTREGTVYVNGAATSALGLLNGSAATSGALHSQLTITGPKGHSLKWYFNVTGGAQAQVYFSPELGLIPYSLSPGETWNSTAAFSLSGSYSLSWQFVGPKASASGSPSGGISKTGTVDLEGAYSQDLSLSNKEHTHVLLLALSGPFDVYDGVIILPHLGDLFSGDPASVPGGQSLGFAPAAATAAVDYDPSAGHLGIAAASTSFGPTTAGAVPSTALSPAAGPVGSGDVQAQPLSVAAAESCASSLLSGGTCSPAPIGINIGPFHVTLVELVVLVVGVVVLVTVLAVAVGRRPRAPPPVQVSAQAARVPPGPAGQLAPPPRTPPQQPSDPLGNLW